MNESRLGPQLPDLTTSMCAGRHGGDDHGHSHGDDDNVAVQAALAHVIGDIAAWIAAG